MRLPRTWQSATATIVLLNRQFGISKQEENPEVSLKGGKHPVPLTESAIKLQETLVTVTISGATTRTGILEANKSQIGSDILKAAHYAKVD
jgi:hypothetical protein